ncbi:DNA translocase FtsK [Lacunimicrobium album]
MPVTLTVSQVRDALYQGERAEASTDGATTTAMLGRWFHEGLNFLVSNESSESPLFALSQSETDLTTWKALLVDRVYEQFVGPRLTRHCVTLQESPSKVVAFWQAMQAACHWVAELCWTLHVNSSSRRRNVVAPWSQLSESFETDVFLECEFTDPGWSDSVRLTGIADAVVRLTSADIWCVVEFKTGKTSPQTDLGQACLYHMMLSAIESSRLGKQVDSGKLALISFTPERQESFFSSYELTEALQKLRDLIGRLAGVSGDHPRNIASEVPVKTPAGRPTQTNDPADQEYLDMGRRIVETFKEYGVNITLDSEIVVGPTFIRFTIIPGPGTKVAAVEKRAAELQVRLELAAEPFINRDRGRLVIDIQRPHRQTVYFDKVRSQLPAIDPLHGSAVVPVGVDLAGELVCADLSKPEHCHLLVAGTTASGKSEWLRMAIAGLMVTNTTETLRLVIIDPKRNAFHALKNSPYLWQPLVFPDEQPAGEVLKKLCAEMDERYRLLDGADTIADAVAKANKPMPRIVCVCDEYRDLISRDAKERKQIEEQVCRLGAKARAAGIHLILATQQPSRETIKGALDSNMPARVGLKMGRYLESNMLLGEAGAEKLLGHGDLLFKDVNSPRRLQAPLLTEANRVEIFADKSDTN